MGDMHLLLIAVILNQGSYVHIVYFKYQPIHNMIGSSIISINCIATCIDADEIHNAATKK